MRGFIDLHQPECACPLCQRGRKIQELEAELVSLRAFKERWAKVAEAAMKIRVADSLCLTLDDYITIEMEELLCAALAARDDRKE